MEQSFYKNRLIQNHMLDVIIPSPSNRASIHQIIYEELCLGKVVPSSRDEYRRVITDLAAQGAEAIILGCTEISLLISQSDSALPLFDTTAIHAKSAAEHSLGDA